MEKARPVVRKIQAPPGKEMTMFPVVVPEQIRKNPDPEMILPRHKQTARIRQIRMQK